MGRPYGLLRAGYPFLKTLGMRRITNYPNDVAIGDEGRVYILCRSEGQAEIRVWSFDDAERLTDELIGIGGYGSDEGKFTWPVNIILDSEENVYVSDEAIHRISAFGKDGEFIGCWGEEGSADGQFSGPAGIVFDADENLYVADALNHRVQKFSKDGEFISGWGCRGDGPGQFDMPWGVTLDEIGDVYVVDWRNDRVQKFTADGEFVFQIGSSGSGEGHSTGRPASPWTSTATSTSRTPATTGCCCSTKTASTSRDSSETHALQSRPRLHADKRLSQPPARHGGPRNREVLQVSQVRKSR